MKLPHSINVIEKYLWNTFSMIFHIRQNLFLCSVLCVLYPLCVCFFRSASFHSISLFIFLFSFFVFFSIFYLFFCFFSLSAFVFRMLWVLWTVLLFVVRVSLGSSHSQLKLKLKYILYKSRISYRTNTNAHRHVFQFSVHSGFYYYRIACV